MPHAHSHGGATGEEFNRQAQAPPIPTQSQARNRPPTPYETERYYLDEKMQIDTSMKELGFSDTEPPSEMPPWFIAFYEQYVRQRDEMVRMVMAPRANSLPPYSKPLTSSKPSGRSSFSDDSDQESIIEKDFGASDLEHGQVDPMVYKKMSMDITLLEGGILFHSIFVGMTVSITTDGFIVLLVAIMFHQTFEGLGLGSRIAAVPYPKGSIKPWLLVFAFGTTAPIGQAIGLITRNSYDPESAFALILVGFFNAFSSGLLIYAGLVDLLHADFLSEEADRVMNGRTKMWAFFWVLMGGKQLLLFILMCLELSLHSCRNVGRRCVRLKGSINIRRHIRLVDNTWCRVATQTVV
jgi:zinc transporter ZupT